MRVCECVCVCVSVCMCVCVCRECEGEAAREKHLRTHLGAQN